MPSRKKSKSLKINLKVNIDLMNVDNFNTVKIQQSKNETNHFVNMTYLI